MTDIESPDSQQQIRTLHSAFRIPHSALLWGVTALVVTLLALRFAMRLLGVRPDIPFPGFVYSLTAPLVEPFYRFFPVSDRFDYYAVEWASLLAAGCILVAALLIYIAALLLYTFWSGTPRNKRATGGPQT